ncbi:nuclear transport factor 2 family protein [Streptomyces mirabilis]|uniref:nuclear transport factor 2 family protein n=1 Tax=Streptomyces mirabilis TaxID=68239 RepID=UPI003647F7E1
MHNITKLVEAHLHAWAVSDPHQRAEHIARIYTEDVTVVEPDGIVHGTDALNARIGRLQEHFSGLEFSVNGSIQHHHDYAMYQWTQPTDTRLEDVIGWDVLHFDGDLIDRAVMFIPGFDLLDVPGHDVS